MQTLVPGFQFFTAAHIAARYQTYVAQNAYVYNEGVVVVPVAGPNTTPKVRARRVRLHSPHGYRVFSWSVERVRLKPLLPKMVKQNDDEVFLWGRIVVQPPEIEAGGNMHLYRVEGTYWYGLLAPLNHEDQLRMGATPYDITPASVNVCSPGDFTEQLQ